MARTRTMLLGLALLAWASRVSAAPILNTIPEGEIPVGGGGMWIGAMERSAPTDPTNSYYTPDGTTTYTVAQTFVAYRDYSDVTARVVLYTGGGGNLLDALGAPLSVSFRVLTDGGGMPGSELAATNVVLSATALTTYALDFGSLSLVDGHTYWLVASSPNVRVASPVCCPGGTLPIWRTSTTWAGARAHQQNALPWFVTADSFMFALEGTETGDPIANGDGPPKRPAEGVPEPSTLLLLACSLPLAAGALRGVRA